VVDADDLVQRALGTPTATVQHAARIFMMHGGAIGESNHTSRMNAARVEDEDEEDVETHDSPRIDVSPVAVVAPPLAAAAQRNVAILLGAVALAAVSKLAVPRLLRLLSRPNVPAAASPFVCSLDLRAGEGKALANTTFALCDLCAPAPRISTASTHDVAVISLVDTDP
jgi:hypothetical protein